MTSERGYLPLTHFSTVFPSTLGILLRLAQTIYSASRQTSILPAANSLLPKFQSDFRRLKNHGGRVMLVDAFVKHQHPVKRFNNAVTLTLWGLPPSRHDTLQLQVGTMLKWLVCHAYTCHCILWYHTVPAAAGTAYTCLQLSACYNFEVPLTDQNGMEAACRPVASTATCSVLTNISDVMRDCLPVATIIYRILGKDLADLLYAGTDEDQRGCKLMRVAMLALQLQHVRSAPLSHCIFTMAYNEHEAMHSKGCRVPTRMLCTEVQVNMS